MSVIEPAILLLEDGTCFYGKSAGLIGTTYGEIAFNTGMAGYQEIFTDPSYFGQILVMAAAHIGNYGVHEKEVESEKIKIAGMVCKKFARDYSRESAGNSLQEYFEKDGLVGICEVDTRALIRHIRSKGAMNAIISSEISDRDELMKILKKVPSMEGLELSSKVSCSKAYTLGNENSAHRVAVWDLGIKKNIIRCLLERDCYLKVFPLKTGIEEIMDFKPDGIMISNGPGDPSAMKEEISKTALIIDSGIPVFGICLGFQIIALSQGLKTAKMFNGHRGINHPVKNLISAKGEITSQNHGFKVILDESKKNDKITITHVHLNDGSLAGLKLNDKPVTCVQYHPESSPGPHDSRYLFDEFIFNMVKHQSNVLSA